MEELRVTVILACYNDSHYIQGAIDSCLKQDYKGPLTICVINDGSTDDSWDVISQNINSPAKDFFENSDVLIKWPQNVYADTKIVAINTANGGPSSARNIGIRYTLHDTDIYAVLDADDEMFPNKISSLVDVMKQDMQSIGVVYGDYENHHLNTGKVIREYKEPYSRRRLLEECIVHSGSIINKKAFVATEESTGYYDVTMRTCEDYDLWMRISEKFVIQHVPKCLTMVRTDGENSSFVVEKRIWERNWGRVMDKLHERLNAKVQ